MLSIRHIGVLGAALLLFQKDGIAASALSQEKEPDQGGQVLDAATDVPVVTTATQEELDAMLRFFRSAMEDGEAAGVIEALRRMELHDNEELIAPALEALKYEASKKDEVAVAEEANALGISKRKEIKDRLLELESTVQAVGARVLGSIPGKASTSALMKVLKNKKVRKDRPLTMAAVISALGSLGHEKAADVVEDELKQGRHKLIARASVRFFGQIKTKDLGVVRILISMLDPPEPVNVDDASNPPASYWAGRWETWSNTRRDVTWALNEITGQTFRPAEGDQPSDSARAWKYVKDNKRALGLR